MVASNAAADPKVALLNVTTNFEHPPTISDAPAFYAHGPGCCQQPSSPTGIAAGGPFPAAQGVRADFATARFTLTCLTFCALLWPDSAIPTVYRAIPKPS